MGKRLLVMGGCLPAAIREEAWKERRGRIQSCAAVCHALDGRRTEYHPADSRIIQASLWGVDSRIIQGGVWGVDSRVIQGGVCGVDWTCSLHGPAVAAWEFCSQQHRDHSACDTVWVDVHFEATMMYGLPVGTSKTICNGGHIILYFWLAC